MKVFKKYSISLLVSVLLVSLIFALPVAAQMQQQQPMGMISVDLSSVRNDLAKNLNVKADQIPEMVQAPVGVAAQVCDKDANDLAKQMQSGQATCKAKTTSQALNQIVLRQMGSSQKY